MPVPAVVESRVAPSEACHRPTLPIGENGHPLEKIAEFDRRDAQAVWPTPWDVAVLKLCYVDFRGGQGRRRRGLRRLPGHPRRAGPRLPRHGLRGGDHAPHSRQGTARQGSGRRSVAGTPSGPEHNVVRQQFNAADARGVHPRPATLFDIAADPVHRRGRRARQPTSATGRHVLRRWTTAYASDPGHLNARRGSRRGVRVPGGAWQTPLRDPGAVAESWWGSGIDIVDIAPLRAPRRARSGPPAVDALVHRRQRPLRRAAAHARPGAMAAATRFAIKEAAYKALGARFRRDRCAGATSRSVPSSTAGGWSSTGRSGRRQTVPAPTPSMSRRPGWAGASSRPSSPRARSQVQTCLRGSLLATSHTRTVQRRGGNHEAARGRPGAAGDRRRDGPARPGRGRRISR